MEQFVRLISDLHITDYIRGFATNVAGYQPLGEMCPEFDYCLLKYNNAGHPCCPQDPDKDSCGFELRGQWNPSHNEHMYAKHLRKAMGEGIAGFEPHMIIDTGRNGETGMRQDCANWCNIRGA